MDSSIITFTVPSGEAGDWTIEAPLWRRRYAYDLAIEARPGRPDQPDPGSKPPPGGLMLNFTVGRAQVAAQ